MEQLPKIVQHGLRGTAKPEVHPDPDLLTAFAEKSLNDRERVHVIEHLAECADCRDVLSLAMPEVATETLQLRPRSFWLSWPVMRWGALAACVVVVGAAITLHYDRQTSLGEKLPAAPSRTVVESNVPMLSGATKARVGSPASMLMERDPAEGVDKSAKPKKKLNTETANARAPVSTPQALDASADHPAAPMPAAKTAEPEQLAKTRNDALDYTARASNRAEMVGNAASIPMEQKADISKLKEKDRSGENELHKEAQTAGAARGALLANQKADQKADTVSRQTAEVTGAFADRSRVKGNAPHWTISRDGNLQRSFDSGKTWQTIPIGSRVVFRALSVNDFDIWVGGAAGALYHSSDAGEHWTQIQPAIGGAALTSDIVTLEFGDANHGKLTTSNHEIWITSDAGETWRNH